MRYGQYCLSGWIEKQLKPQSATVLYAQGIWTLTSSELIDENGEIR